MTGSAGIPARYFLTGRAGIKKEFPSTKVLGCGQGCPQSQKDARTPGKQKAPLSQGLIYYEKRPPRQ